MILKFVLLALFGIAMAHLEGVVVVYLRKSVGMSDSNTDNAIILQNMPGRYIKIEMTREAATIVMLVLLALLVGESCLEKIIVFLWTFAFWDLFYYLSLYLLIKWPLSLTTTDILFLIPRPWIAPVWVPVIISSATIILITIFWLLPF